MNDNIWDNWERFLKPENLRSNLIALSLYVTTYEVLKNSIIEKIKSFYINGFDEKGLIIDKEYFTEVINLNKSPLYASLEWLKQKKAINENDINIFTELKDCRNKLVHEIVNYITIDDHVDPLPLFPKMTALLNKIEKWWLVNVEAEINPAFYENKEMDLENAMPGPLIMLHILANVALGTKEESNYYYDSFKKMKW